MTIARFGAVRLAFALNQLLLLMLVLHSNDCIRTANSNIAATKMLLVCEQ